MTDAINYDDKTINSFNSNNILYNKFNLTDIKFLEKPTEILDNDKSYTLIKIICNRKLKVFLKNIERILNDDEDNEDNILVSINYCIEKNKDYYELLLNKKINELLDTEFNINENYNIVVSLTDKLLLWKIHSIEVNDNNKLINPDLLENDLDLEDFDPDYEEIVNSLKEEINSILNNINLDIDKLNKNKIELENILNNLDLNKLEDYRNLLNSYSD